MQYRITGHPTALLLAVILATGLLVGCGQGSQPSLTPEPSVLLPEHVVANFVDLVKSPGFSAETTIFGEVTSAGVRTRLEVEGSISGDDGDVSLTRVQGASTVNLDAVFVGDAAYVREPDQPWQTSPSRAAELSGVKLDPFVFVVSVDQLNYEGTTTFRGHEVHELQNVGALREDGVSDSSIGLVRILVEDDGTPVYMSYRFETMIPDANGNQVRAAGEVEQTFSAVGSPVVIEAPAS